MTRSSVNICTRYIHVRLCYSLTCNVSFSHPRCPPLTSASLQMTWVSGSWRHLLSHKSYQLARSRGWWRYSKMTGTIWRKQNCPVLLKWRRGRWLIPKNRGREMKQCITEQNLSGIAVSLKNLWMIFSSRDSEYWLNPLYNSHTHFFF